jgi:hypothetical protein
MFNIRVYGFAGLFTDPATVEKLSNDHSNFVVVPPFPVVVNVTASFTVVDVLFASKVPDVVGVEQGEVAQIENVPCPVPLP